MRPLKVGEVNTYIKKILMNDMILSNIEVIGEVSNYTHHYSGHRYFSLKDETGVIKSVMFKTYGDKLDIKLEEGSQISAKGYISVYEKTGEYQLYIREITDLGVGDLYRRFEELKVKLEKEGLFSSEYKKEIPKMPNKIGLVTSSTGAAVRDMIDVIHRRMPMCNIVLYPALVQGKGAPRSIIKGIKHLDLRSDVDLIIVGRGGGSIDELFAFNDEELARVIFNCNKPIISAVGHETDFTIADFVADLRAATPSVAAEISVPDINDFKDGLNSLRMNLINSMAKIVTSKKTKLEIVSRELKYTSPVYKIQDKRQEIDLMFRDLMDLIDKKILLEKNILMQVDKRLVMLNPNLGLEKGYGILTNGEGRLVKSIEDVVIGEDIQINLKDGRFSTQVKKIEGGCDYGN